MKIELDKDQMQILESLHDNSCYYKIYRGDKIWMPLLLTWDGRLKSHNKKIFDNLRWSGLITHAMSFPQEMWTISPRGKKYLEELENEENN